MIEQAIGNDPHFRWRLAASKVILDITRMVEFAIDNQETLVNKLREQNELIRQQNDEIKQRNRKLDDMLHHFREAEEDDTWWREGRQPPGHDLEDK